MSDHIPAEMLGTYYATPDRLEEHHRKAIEEHLVSCRFCAEVAERMRFFSQEHVIPDDAEVHDLADEIIRKLSAHGASLVVALHPVVSTAAGEEAHVTRLAAATASQARYIGVMTWASEDGSFVLHVSKDQRLNRYIARIFTDEERDLSGIWMRFDEHPDVVLTDADGTVRLPGDIGHIRLLQPTLVFPFLRFALDDAECDRLRRLENLDIEIPDRGMALSLQHDGHVLRIFLREYAEEVHAIAMLGAENQLSRVSERCAVFPMQQLQSPMTFAFYHFADNVAPQ